MKLLNWSHKDHPFGMQMPGRNFSSDEYRYGFNGMEKDDEVKGSGNSLDFGARIYDSRIGRWLSVDPLFKKFPDFTPYSFVNNMPIWAIDPDGRDIIVLSYGDNPPGNHNTGHQAILIGNDETGWMFYSGDKDGQELNDKGELDDRVTIGQPFKSIQEFADSEFNMFKYNYDVEGTKTAEKGPDGKIYQRFKQGYRIKTSTEIDDKMKAAATENLEKGYGFFTNNCTHCVRDALDAGGLENGENTLVDAIYFESIDMYYMIYEENYTPQAKQSEIEAANVGTDVSDQLKPSRLKEKSAETTTQTDSK